MSDRVETVARLSAALEALHDGQTQLAIQILQDLRREREIAELPAGQRYRCEECGQRFRWPGERDHHEQMRHRSAARWA